LRWGGGRSIIMEVGCCLSTPRLFLIQVRGSVNYVGELNPLPKLTLGINEESGGKDVT